MKVARSWLTEKQLKWRSYFMLANGHSSSYALLFLNYCGVFLPVQYAFSKWSIGDETLFDFHRWWFLVQVILKPVSCYNQYKLNSESLNFFDVLHVLAIHWDFVWSNSLLRDMCALNLQMKGRIVIYYNRGLQVISWHDPNILLNRSIKTQGYLSHIDSSEFYWVFIIFLSTKIRENILFSLILCEFGWNVFYCIFKCCSILKLLCQILILRSILFL